MNICVFCGSSLGDNPIYRDAAQELGRQLAKDNHTLIYGGGNIGLMGILADSVLKHGGKVIGVIPDFLRAREVGHDSLSQLIIVDSMHERKKKMADLADAFIALPGGWGTLEETAEVLTWWQLGLMEQPVGILNINNFYDSLISQMNRMVHDGFLKADNFDSIRISSTPGELLSLIIP